MKTTIDLPDELLHRAKVTAAQRKTTLKELVLQGLDHVISNPVSDSEANRKEGLKEIINRMRASNNNPMAPLKRNEIHDR